MDPVVEELAIGNSFRDSFEGGAGDDFCRMMALGAIGLKQGFAILGADPGKWEEREEKEERCA